MNRQQFQSLCFGTVIFALGTLSATASRFAHAQNTTNPLVRAQQQYELDLAVCNMAGFVAPDRESCIREAGLRLARARGVPATVGPAISGDGRATIMTPTPGLTPRGSTTAITSDGRATVVVPEPATP